ncbi:hypothetical protein N9B14_04805 [Akkermansiaceae bacterium]|nr:hypothetical protein [Akkermansiaceae bacterium]
MIFRELSVAKHLSSLVKHLKSSFQDLHRLFEQSITVRDIAEPLTSFDYDYCAKKARLFMDKNGFDVLGVQQDGVTRSYVLRDSLEEGKVGDYSHKLGSNDILSESEPLLNALDVLSERQWIFIRFLGNPSGVVTRGDLQKAPVRMWLFGLVSLLEMQMLRCIRACEETEGWWQSLLATSRNEMAKQLYKQRKMDNVEIFVSDCLQLCDKGTIFRKDERLFQYTGYTAKSDWKSFMKRIESLRNNLAHSNDLGSESMSEIAVLAREMEKVLSSLEKQI